MEKIKVEAHNKYCVVMDKLVDLVQVFGWFSDGMDTQSGHWIERSARCSEFDHCQEQCKWAHPLSLVTEDPLHEVTFNEVCDSYYD